MKMLLNRAVVVVFCLALAAPVVPGLAICIGEGGHAEIVVTVDEHCCSDTEHSESAGTHSHDDHELASSSCCIDIPLCVDTLTKVIPSRPDVGFKSFSPCVVFEIPDLTLQIQARVFTLASVPARDSSLAQIRTIVFLA